MVITESFILYLLVLVRLLSFIMVLPVFSMRQIPSTVKLMVGVMLTFFTASQLQTTVTIPESLIELGLLVIQETLLGIVFGYSATIIFLAIQSAGDFIDFMSGLKMASSYDPISGVNSSLYSTLYNWIGVMLFFNLDCHHYLFRAIINSFYLFEAGTDLALNFQIDSISYLITRMFLIALSLALPISVIVFLVDIILGIISKIIPQMNVFLLGFPLKILISCAMQFLIAIGTVSTVSWALDSVVSIVDFFVKSLV